MKKIVSYFKQTWRELGQNIYVGERRQNNLRAITFVSILSAVLGLVMAIMNIVEKNGLVVISSFLFFIGGTVSAIASSVFKARRVSVITALSFSLGIFTIYAITGSMNGYSVIWAMIMPVGVSYFLSVKSGIIVSVYYELLCVILFYTPVREWMKAYYTDYIMSRFPLIFLTLTGFTAISMIQYHRMVLRDNAYAERLNTEVKAQTEVAMERLARMEQMTRETVSTLAIAIDAKDRYTNGHSFRVASYSVALARRLNWQEDEVEAMRREALLHDIGKIGVSDLILNKPGKLTEEEYKIIQSHTFIGGKILDEAGSLAGAADVARFHHERYDGTGYPSGLKGEDIPLHARILSIADAYDAMRSDRIYRQGLSSERIRQELIQGRGTQFDPALLDVFLQMVDSGELTAIEEEANRQLARALELGLTQPASCAGTAPSATGEPKTETSKG